MTDAPKGTNMTQIEAVTGFAAWLSTRAESTTFGASHERGDISNLLEAYSQANGLGHCRDGWKENLTHPTEEELEEIRTQTGDDEDAITEGIEDEE